MGGYQIHEGGAPEVGRLLGWESQAVDAVGTVIEFWGFKRNHGRLWALLYLRGRALAAAEIQEELGLSKGAVSMVTRELEQWGMVQRVRVGRSRSWRFQAESDLLALAGRVLLARERPLVARARAELIQARASASRDPATAQEDLDRLARLGDVAAAVGQAIDLFLTTASLDLADAMAALHGEGGRGA